MQGVLGHLQIFAMTKDLTVNLPPQYVQMAESFAWVNFNLPVPWERTARSDMKVSGKENGTLDNTRTTATLQAQDLRTAARTGGRRLFGMLQMSHLSSDTIGHPSPRFLLPATESNAAITSPNDADVGTAPSSDSPPNLLDELGDQNQGQSANSTGSDASTSLMQSYNDRVQAFSDSQLEDFRNKGWDKFFQVLFWFAVAAVLLITLHMCVLAYMQKKQMKMRGLFAIPRPEMQLLMLGLPTWASVAATLTACGSDSALTTGVLMMCMMVLTVVVAAFYVLWWRVITCRDAEFEVTIDREPKSLMPRVIDTIVGPKTESEWKVNKGGVDPLFVDRWGALFEDLKGPMNAAPLPSSSPACPSQQRSMQAPNDVETGTAGGAADRSSGSSSTSTISGPGSSSMLQSSGQASGRNGGLSTEFSGSCEIEPRSGHLLTLSPLPEGVQSSEITERFRRYMAAEGAVSYANGVAPWEARKPFPEQGDAAVARSQEQEETTIQSRGKRVWLLVRKKARLDALPRNEMRQMYVVVDLSIKMMVGILIAAFSGRDNDPAELVILLILFTIQGLWVVFLKPFICRGRHVVEVLSIAGEVVQIILGLVLSGRQAEEAKKTQSRIMGYVMLGIQALIMGSQLLNHWFALLLQLKTVIVKLMKRSWAGVNTVGRYARKIHRPSIPRPKSHRPKSQNLSSERLVRPGSASWCASPASSFGLPTPTSSSEMNPQQEQGQVQDSCASCELHAPTFSLLDMDGPMPACESPEPFGTMSSASSVSGVSTAQPQQTGDHLFISSTGAMRWSLPALVEVDEDQLSHSGQSSAP
ncbi:hypothetical protein CBR_g23830 [Chara braunii]|uniref:TRP C-terminal domain-containing protein n=1 Tax=Chara braunii TaxID=69332 RepID=A0A388JVN8_CHABU|nr:hypothetical protein CBR_g23830 [Chara braunii]|eukprot:GBG61879.1 hypothetical protein CBR_g23830 [Chara braunii]